MISSKGLMNIYVFDSTKFRWKFDRLSALRFATQVFDSKVQVVDQSDFKILSGGREILPALAVFSTVSHSAGVRDRDFRARTHFFEGPDEQLCI